MHWNKTLGEINWDKALGEIHWKKTLGQGYPGSRPWVRVGVWSQPM